MHFAAKTQEGACCPIGQTSIRSQKHIPDMHHEPREDEVQHGRPDHLLHSDGEMHSQYTLSVLCGWVMVYFILLKPQSTLQVRVGTVYVDLWCLGCYMLSVLWLGLWEGRFLLSSVVGSEYYSQSHWRPWERQPLITAVCNTSFYSQLSCLPPFPPLLQSHPSPQSFLPFLNKILTLKHGQVQHASIHHYFTDFW